jgi:hypothetical protein
MSIKRNIQVLTAVAAMFAFSAVAAASAQAAGDAPRWTVTSANPVTPLQGTEFSFSGISTGSENAAMEQAKEVGKLEVPSLFELTNPKGGCTVTGKINGSAANTSGTVTEVRLQCHEVTVAGFPKCVVEDEIDSISGTVTTTLLHGVTEWLEATGDRTGVTFTPAAGEPFTRLLVTNKAGETGCIFNGLTVNVTGSIIGEVETPNTDKATQALNFPTPAIVHAWSNATPRVKTATTDGLMVGGIAATFTNTFDITLNGNPLWGVETG